MKEEPEAIEMRLRTFALFLVLNVALAVWVTWASPRARHSCSRMPWEGLA